MARYSIRKQGGDYVVLVGDQSILKFTSRRKAAKLVAEASELLSVQSALSGEDEQECESTGCERRKAP